MTIDHDALSAMIRRRRKVGASGLLPELPAAYLDLYDEVKRLRAALADARRLLVDAMEALERTDNASPDGTQDERQIAMNFMATLDENRATLAKLRAHLGETECDLRLALDEARARAEKLEAERDALRAALVDHNDLLRSASQIAKREGMDGEIASTNWDAYYNRVAVVLKRHHAISNEAHQALKGTDQ